MAFSKNAALPLHVQLENELRGLIESGEYAAGQRLAPELELAASFGVNRLTVRQALAELARAGLIVARQGVGTFVARRPQPFTVALSATDWAVEYERGTRAAQLEGRSIAEELLDVEQVDARAAPAEYLGRGSMLWIEAVHRIDGDPILRTQYWTRSSLTPYEIRDIASGGLTGALWRQIVGADMYYTWRSFDAIAADRRHAAVLDVSVGSPLLQRCGLNSDVTGRPLLYLQRDAPSGRMRIVVPSYSPQGTER